MIFSSTPLFNKFTCNLKVPVTSIAIICILGAFVSGAYSDDVSRGLKVVDVGGWTRLSKETPFHNGRLIYGKSGKIEIALPGMPTGSVRFKMEYFDSLLIGTVEIWYGCDKARFEPLTLVPGKWVTMEEERDFSRDCNHKQKMQIKIDHIDESAIAIRSIDVVHDGQTEGSSDSSDSKWTITCNEDCDENIFKIQGELINMERGIPEDYKRDLDTRNHYQLKAGKEFSLTLESPWKNLAHSNLCFEPLFDLPEKQMGQFSLTLKRTDPTLDDATKSRPINFLLDRQNCDLSNQPAGTEGHFYNRYKCNLCIQDSHPALDGSGEVHKLKLSLKSDSGHKIGFLLLENPHEKSFSLDSGAQIMSRLPNIVALGTPGESPTWTSTVHQYELRQQDASKAGGGGGGNAKYAGLGLFGFDKVMRLGSLTSMKPGLSQPIVLRSGWLKLADSPDRFKKVFVYYARLHKLIHKISLQLRIYNENDATESERTQVVFEGPRQDNDLQYAINLDHDFNGEWAELIENKHFRFSLKHEFKTDVPEGTAFDPENPLEIVIQALGFGDNCLIPPEGNSKLCHNDAICLTDQTCHNGFCDCKPGFVGEFCETSNVCLKAYGYSINGYHHCKAMGAQCRADLPEIRCDWGPEDKYYQRKTDTGITPKPEEETDKDKAQARAWVVAIIILFLALTILLIIIILGMIQRLRKANSKLDSVRGEITEMSRQRFGRPSNSNNLGQPATVARLSIQNDTEMNTNL